MINLIPPSAKITVKREYWLRVASVWSILVGVGVLAVASLLVPVLVMIDNQLKVFNESYQTATEDNAQFKELSSELTAANETAALLQSNSDNLLFSALIQEMRGLAGTAIAINSIRVVRSEEGVSLLDVSGVADTRAALAAYRDALTASEMFATASLPLSNLAQDQNISFVINITVAPLTDEAI